jgi:hypothetical protein
MNRPDEHFAHDPTAALDAPRHDLDEPIPPVTIRCPTCRNKITVPVTMLSTQKVGNTALVELTIGDYTHTC